MASNCGCRGPVTITYELCQSQARHAAQVCRIARLRTLANAADVRFCAAYDALKRDPRNAGLVNAKQAAAADHDSLASEYGMLCNDASVVQCSMADTTTLHAFVHAGHCNNTVAGHRH